ncbi:MAG: hypothetical protein Q9176_001066 [Flavoplaca citrina]
MPQRVCFVTIGATAAFNQLLQAVLDSLFLRTLQASGYTKLLLQYGKDGHSILEAFRAEVASGDADDYGIDISGFDFNKMGLGQEMSSVKAAEDRTEGVVISHAGSGSILDAMRIDVPLIAVPNTSLLHNHQVDLAEELARQGYLVHGRLESVRLYGLPFLLIVSPAKTSVAIYQQRSPSLTSSAERGRPGLRRIMVLILPAEVWPV